MEEVQERLPGEYRSYKSGDVDYAIPGGESAFASATTARSRALTTWLTDTPAPASSSSPTAAYSTAYSAAPSASTPPLSRRFKLYNASLNTLLIDRDTWTLGTWGDISHLKGLGTHDDW